MRRIVQQVAGDPCNLQITGQRNPKGVLVQTQPVRDCSRNPVPDGTIVTFTENGAGRQEFGGHAGEAGNRPGPVAGHRAGCNFSGFRRCDGQSASHGGEMMKRLDWGAVLPARFVRGHTIDPRLLRSVSTPPCSLCVAAPRL